MTQTVATVILIITIILWGSWYQFSKKLRGWPVAAFMLWLYFFSALVVWAGVLIIKPFFIAESLGQIIANNPGRCAVALLCGAIFSIGVQMNVIVVKNVIRYMHFQVEFPVDFFCLRIRIQSVMRAKYLELFKSYQRYLFRSKKF